MRPHLSHLLFSPLLAFASAVAWIGDRASAEDLLLRVNASQLDYKTTVTLAELALPAKMKVYASETLGTVINRQCGRSDEHYLRLLQERASRYPTIAQPMTLQSAILSDHELELPFCLVLPIKPLEVAWEWPSTASMRDFASLPQLGAYPRVGTPDIVARPDFVFPSIDYEGWSAVPLPGDRNRRESLDKIFAALQTVPPPTARSPPPPIAAYRQDGIGVVSVLDTSEDRCPERQMPAGKYPFDAIELVRVLGMNQARGRTKFSGHAEILIADTGLSEETASNFASALIGSGLDPETARLPTTDYPKWRHGAYVASAALGGAYFLRFSELMDHPIKIRPINLIQNKDGKLNSEKLLKVIDRGRRTTSVINLSISYDGEISGLKTVLDQQRNALFVAAAGNAPAYVTRENPAALGGQYPNLIIVSSLNQDGEPETKQSTWSPAHVELAAHGCRVPVHEDGKEKVIVFRSGSSLAAPLVSFTAAILGKYDIGGPADIKTRLLASADYDPKLDGKVKRSLKLNVVRAVAVANDVVETSSMDEAPIYGKISAASGMLLKLCKGDHSMGRGTNSAPGAGNRSLLSMDVFEQHGKKSIFFLYQTHPTRNLESHTCDLDPEMANHEIVVEEQDGRGTRTFRVGGLRKLLFSPY